MAIWINATAGDSAPSPSLSKILAIPYSDLSGFDKSDADSLSSSDEVDEYATHEFLSTLWKDFSNSDPLALQITKSAISQGGSSSSFQQSYSLQGTFVVRNLEGSINLIPLPGDNTGKKQIDSPFPNAELLAGGDTYSADSIAIESNLSALSDDSREDIYRIFHVLFSSHKLRGSSTPSSIVGLPSNTPSGLTPGDDTVWSVSSLSEASSRELSFLSIQKSITIEYFLDSQQTWGPNHKVQS